MDGSKAFPERLGDPAPTTSPVPSPPPSPRLSMGVLRNIVIGVIAISFLTFVALFGQLPALRKTPIGWLQRLLCLHIPNGLRAADRVATGGKITLRSKRLGRYLFYEKNPVVLILFLALLAGSALLFLWNALSELPTRLILPIPLVLVPPFLFTWLCVTHRAHHITPSNHHTRLRDYPFDYTLFYPQNTCTTCHLEKPARSKHCSLCGVCVAMCDHHCPWINSCVGRGNYRHFLALLLSLGIVEIYGAYLSWWILRPNLTTDPNNAFFSKAHFNEILRATVIAVNIGGLSIAGVGMLAAATAALPLGLMAYHCYLIWAGMTTNESQKWADLREDMADGFAFKGSREALQTHNKLRKYDDRSAVFADGNSNPALRSGEGMEEVYVSWPIGSDQIVTRTTDGRPPFGQEALWTRVWNLSDVVNLYDLGGWDNFMEVLKGR